MEDDILENLNLMGYAGPVLDKEVLSKVIAGGAKNSDYTGLVHYLCKELKDLCNLDECVQGTHSSDDSAHFLLELSSFLKEINCPYQCLTQGHMSDRLSTVYDKTLLLDYLTKELLAAKMVKVNQPDKNMELKIHETPEANDLKHLLLALKFSKPPPNITANVLFQKVEAKLVETVKRAGPDLCGNPLFTGFLSDKQWEKLLEAQNTFHEDYKLRREMLLKRLDCTVQSFQWSDKLKGKEEKIIQIYENKRKNLKVDVDIDISDLLAARDDVPIIENQRISGASVRKNTQTKLTKHIIGPVPDRGGRPSEQAPPPPEMPSWQQRSSGPAGGGRGGGRGGRGGNDNFVKGGGDRGRGSNFNQGGNPQNYDNRGGHNQGFNQNHDNRNTNYNRGYDNRNNYDNRGYDNSSGGYNNRGSGYDNHSSSSGGYNDRRSYNDYQVNKTSYAEQYVQESQQNQQYSGRNRDYSSRGQPRGRSNYNRGGYR